MSADKPPMLSRSIFEEIMMLIQIVMVIFIVIVKVNIMISEYQLLQRDQYSIGQQTRTFGCAVTKAYTWRHVT